MTIRIIGLVFVVLGMGALASWTTVQVMRPHCPTEDSCAVDYHDGQWFIDGHRVTR